VGAVSPRLDFNQIGKDQTDNSVQHVAIHLDATMSENRQSIGASSRICQLLKNKQIGTLPRCDGGFIQKL
jgi:hypothetical protein